MQGLCWILSKEEKQLKNKGTWAGLDNNVQNALG